VLDVDPEKAAVLRSGHACVLHARESIGGVEFVTRHGHTVGCTPGGSPVEVVKVVVQVMARFCTPPPHEMGLGSAVSSVRGSKHCPQGPNVSFPGSAGGSIVRAQSRVNTVGVGLGDTLGGKHGHESGTNTP